MESKRIVTEASFKFYFFFFLPPVWHLLLNFILKGCFVQLCLNLSRDLFLRLKIRTMGSNCSLHTYSLTESQLKSI